MVFIVVVFIFVHQFINNYNKILCILFAEVEDFASDRCRKLIRFAGCLVILFNGLHRFALVELDVGLFGSLHQNDKLITCKSDDCSD